MSKASAHTATAPATTGRPSGGMVLRSLLLPFEVVRSLGAGLGAVAACAGDDAALAAAIAADESTLATRLRALVADPAVREALFCASPTLDEALQAWLAGAEGGRAAGVLPVRLDPRA